VVRDTYAEASAALGYDLAALTFDGPAERLNQTDVTQPALLVHSIAVFRLLAERGLRFDLTLGHSLGEYSALVASGAVPFVEAVDLVRRRGAAMHTAAQRHPGGMAAVLGLDDPVVEELCAGLGDVWPANFNSPGQVVVSGSHSGLDELGRAATRAGARKVVRLAVSGAFHSPYMRAAADELRPALETAAWASPSPQFFSVCTVEYEAGDFAHLLARQVCAPVRFTHAVRRLVREGAEAFLEVGSGAVLCGLVRRIATEAVTARAGDCETVDNLDAAWFS
jgi:[acyl-carrier-protein] S-malonyltransferase